MKAIRLVMFGGAGAPIDHRSRAPMLAFVESFAHFGARAMEAEARARGLMIGSATGYVRTIMDRIPSAAAVAARAGLRQRAAKPLRQAAAGDVIDSTAELPAWLEER